MNLSLKYRVAIPGGSWKDGTCVRNADLRPLNGGDEAFLLEVGDSLSAAARNTALLSRCLLRVGTNDNVTPGEVRSLTVGDREALLLHLWRITFGERLSCVVTCDVSACGARMDLELKVSDLLLPPYNESREWTEMTIHLKGRDCLVRVRAANGMDQELAAEHGRTSLKEGEALLLRRCVRDVCTDDRGPLPAEECTDELAESIGDKMIELDPQAEILLQLRCVACDHAFTAEFDTGNYLYRSLRAQIPYIYQEVHRIASSYHWSESEILSMTPRKRSVYLDLLGGEAVH